MSKSMNREILRLAVPNIISNISIPLLGMVDTAIAGRIGDDINIAALAIGTTIFDFIYWNCAFLRMGTGGLTAQAFGAGNYKESANLLARSLCIGAMIALLLLVFQRPVGHLSLRLMQGSERVQSLAAEYFFARIWAAPASVMLFGMQGWFIGMQDAKTPMWITILINVVNIIFSVLFVLYFRMGIAGIAWGTVVAQYFGLLISAVFIFKKYRIVLQNVSLKDTFSDVSTIIKFLNVNKDIFLRTFCVTAVYTFFTAASARFGDTILTTNSLLMQLFLLYSFMSDGFAYAGESLSGRFVGERNAESLRQCIHNLIFWALGIGVMFVLIYIFAWKEILMLFNPSETTIACAAGYVGWIILVPLLGSMPFLMDGIMIGATKTVLLRNTVFVSMVLFFVVFYSLSPFIGNNALWIAFNLFLAARGILLYFVSKRLDVRFMIERS